MCRGLGIKIVNGIYDFCFFGSYSLIVVSNWIEGYLSDIVLLYFYLSFICIWCLNLSI